MLEIDEKLVEQAKMKYVGKWIAIKDGKILAASEFHENIYKKLRPAQLDGAYIFYSPTEEKRSMAFFSR